MEVLDFMNNHFMRLYNEIFHVLIKNIFKQASINETQRRDR